MAHDGELTVSKVPSSHACSPIQGSHKRGRIPINYFRTLFWRKKVAARRRIIINQTFETTRRILRKAMFGAQMLEVTGARG